MKTREEIEALAFDKFPDLTHAEATAKFSYPREALRSHSRQAFIEAYELAQQNNSNSHWVAYDFHNVASRPTKSGKYFVHRKDGKVHWETWNGGGWAYNDNVITYWSEIIPPSNGNK